MTIADSLRHLGLSAPDPRSDGELVRRFAHGQEEAAFAELLCRHGPAVLGVCRRVLGNAPDADDAFQAVFLVLARKAATLRDPAAVGGWLHGVAVRTANKARVMNAKRAGREQRAATARVREMPHPLPGGRGASDTLTVIDAELASLPEQYRAAFVACELNGRSRSEAARDLGWPEGTVAARLAKARELLAARLSKRGVTLAVGTFAVAAVPAATASETLAAVRELLAVGTASAVAPAAQQLSDEVVKAMNLFNLKWVAVGVLALTVAAGGAALLAGPGDRRPPREQIKAPVPKAEVSDWKEGKPIELAAGGRITSVAYSPDGKLIALTQDGKLTLLEADTRKRKYAVEYQDRGTITAAAFNPKGDKLAVTRKDAVDVCEAATGTGLDTLEVKGMDPHQVAWTGDVLVTSNGAETQFRTADGRSSGCKGWADNKHKPTALAAGGNSLVYAFNNEPDGKPDPFDLFRVEPFADVSDPTKWRRLTGHKARPTCAAVSRNGNWLITADENGTLIVWEGDEFKEKSRAELGDGVVQLALAPDGKTVAVVRAISGDTGKTDPPQHSTRLELFVFDVTAPSAEPKPLWRTDDPLPGKIAGPVSLAFGPDAKTLLAAFADPYPLAGRGLEGTEAKGKSMGVRVWELVSKK